jgi:isochorismate synthase
VHQRGWGSAWQTCLGGEHRFTQLRAALAHLFARIDTIGDPPPFPPRVYGGLAFTPGSADHGPWRPFGDARFLLPRWSHVQHAGRTWLSLAIDGALGPGPSAASLIGEGALGPGPSAASPDWEGAVGIVQAGIGRGEVDKVVLARREVVRLPDGVSPARVLGRLGEMFPDCTTFGARAGGATFVGATPERLFLKRGDRVWTEALAGSVDAGVPDGARALLASDKERAEHAFVVRDIVRRAQPLCETLAVAERPAVRALRDVLHIHTPIEGRLRAGVGPVDLVEALHPTPAVGGVPAAAALERILALEPEPRGWYSGPIGWIDERGDAELCVALRSALLTRDEAWLYAGAGIVRGSDAAAELEETRIKMRAMRSALGAS